MEVFVAVGGVECSGEFLDSGDDDLVGVVGAFEASDESGCVGVAFDASFLEAVELFACLLVEVFAVDDEEALFDVGVVLEERGGLEGSERFAGACGVPDESVAGVVVDAVDDALDGIDLVGTHDEDATFGLDEDYVAADEVSERVFVEHEVGETEEVGHEVVVWGGCVVDREVGVGSVEAEVLVVVVGEVQGVGAAVADDEELHEAEERVGVAVAAVLLVIDNLLDGLEGRDAVVFEFDLDERESVDEDDDVVALSTVGSVDGELVDDLEVVFAPVAEVDE